MNTIENGLTGGFNIEKIHEYKMGTESKNIESKKEIRERNLMIVGLVICICGGFMLLSNPISGATVAYLAL